MGNNVAHIGEERKVYMVLVGKLDSDPIWSLSFVLHEGKRPLGRPRHRWDQNGSLSD
jgi:hypothetical protein